MTFSRLVHPVEYSDSGMTALADAIALARTYQATLHVVRAQSRRVSNDHEAAAQVRLRNCAAGGGVVPSAIETALVYGDPVSAVAQYAQATAPDLLVVGRTGPRGSNLWRAGVFAKELASVVRRPALVLPSTENREAVRTWPSFKNILCAVDSSPAAAAASQAALAVAKHSRSRLTTFHVLEGAHSVDAVSRDDAILATTTRLNPDLIVIGLPIRGRFDAVFVRSTAPLIVRRTSCAVLMVPDPTDPTELAVPMATLHSSAAS